MTKIDAIFAADDIKIRKDHLSCSYIRWQGRLEVDKSAVDIVMSVCDAWRQRVVAVVIVVGIFVIVDPELNEKMV